MTLSEPLPVWYAAPVAAAPVPIIRRGSPPANVTASVNMTVMEIVSFALYTLSCDVVVTLSTYVGSRRISWRPSSLAADTIACVRPPNSNASMPVAPSSSSKPSTLSAADPAAAKVPSSLMRIIWTPRSSREATTAYVSPPVSNASMPYAPLSSSKPLLSSAADPVASKVPFSWMRASWTPSSSREATMAYALPSILNVSIPVAPISSSKPLLPSAAVAPGESAPSGPMPTSRMLLSLRMAATAYAPPFMVNASTPQRLPSTKRSLPKAADESAEGVPSDPIRSIWMPLSRPAIPTAAYVLPPTSIVSIPVAPWRLPKAAAPLPSTTDPVGEILPSGLMRMPWTPSTHVVTSACALSPRLNAAMPWGPSSLRDLSASALSSPDLGPVTEPAAPRVPFS